jgi:dephospho-CoA kinase
MDTKRIGIAGFMGAGKSTCARFLSDTCGGAGIIDADAEAKHLMQGDESIKRELVETFGAAVVPHGDIAFPVLGAMVFHSAENMSALNRIVHPRLIDVLKERVCADAGPCVICDAALIPLWHIENWFDVLVWVHAPFEKRYGRLKEKTGLPTAQLIKRMELQQTLFDEPKQAPWSVIANHGTREALKIKSQSCILSRGEGHFS